jgi:hypothetical protein
MGRETTERCAHALISRSDPTRIVARSIALRNSRRFPAMDAAAKSATPRGSAKLPAHTWRQRRPPTLPDRRYGRAEEADEWGTPRCGNRGPRETSAPNQLLEVGVGGRNYPDIHLEIVVAAQPLHFSLFQESEDLALQRQGHVSDLIEKQRAAVRRMNASDTRLHRAGERSLGISEEFRFKQSLWMAAQFTTTRGCFLRGLIV